MALPIAERVTGCGFCVRGGRAIADVYEIRYWGGNAAPELWLHQRLSHGEGCRRGGDGAWYGCIPATATALTPSPGCCTAGDPCFGLIPVNTATGAQPGQLLLLSTTTGHL